MSSRLFSAAAPLALLLSTFAPVEAPARTGAVTPEQMRRHIEVLASDEYEGRKPGTPGETKTLAYIVREFARLGLEPAGVDGTWYQPVPLQRPAVVAHDVKFTRSGWAMPFDTGQIVLIGKDASERLVDAPVWFVGRGDPAQLRGANLSGAVVLTLPNPEGGEATAKALRAAGAAAVITVLGEDAPWDTVSAAARRGRDQLQQSNRPEIRGATSMAAARALIGQEQIAAASASSFRPVQLPVRATLDVTMELNAYTSNNVVGRLKGSGKTGESVVYLGHWDHLGICRPEGEADRICNGAVDNASGIAMLIEIARNLSRGKRPERDVLFMATTAEEMGLLGAEYFGANPTVPLNSIVAAMNIDTVAIHRAGEPVAIIGKGTEPLDRLIEQTARELGRKMDTDAEADDFVRRQDGWVLTRAGVPTVMVGGSFSNMQQLGAFLSGPYHKHDDDLARELILDGAAEDADLLIALGRKLADPRIYQRPAR
jgi:hypothetical protein